MTFKIAGSLIFELKRQHTDNLDSIILTERNMPLPLLMTKITNINTNNEGLLQAEFDINQHNMIMDTGHYCLNLIANGNSYRKISLLRETSHNFEQILDVPVDSIIENNEDKIRIGFIVTKHNPHINMIQH